MGPGFVGFVEGMLRRCLAAGVIDQDIESAPFIEDGVDHPVDVGFIGYVGANSQRLYTGRLRFSYGLVNRILSPSANRKLAAFGRECCRNAAPNPLATAGDQRNFATQFEIHGLRLLKHTSSITFRGGCYACRLSAFKAAHP